MNETEWKRPPHRPARPLSDAERKAFDFLVATSETEGRFQKARARQYQTKIQGRKNQDDGLPTETEIVNHGPIPAGTLYIPSVNALPVSKEERGRRLQEQALEEIMNPENTELGLYVRGGGGVEELYRNVLRTMLKRKLKREGKMSRGKWHGKGKGSKPRGRAAAAWVAVVVLILLSSPPWPGIS